jgi:hypothetical protein
MFASTGLPPLYGVHARRLQMSFGGDAAMQNAHIQRD